MNIFDAIAYSISKIDTDTKKADEQPSSDTPPIDLEDDILDQENNNEALFADNPEEDQQEDGYSGSPNLTDELSSSFLELDSELNQSQDPYSTSFAEIDDDINGNDSPKNPIDESWTQNVLDDIESDSESKIEPHISEDSFQELPDNVDQFAPPPEQPNSHYDQLNFKYQQDADPRQRHWFISTIFALLNTTLVIALIIQAGWFHYEKLAKYPVISSIYQLACEKIQCTLPKIEDITKIKSNNLVVRSHPTNHNALIIDTVIVNEAEFNQDFPDLALYFSDINKQIIAQRLIRPDEYLSGELLTWPTMPSRQPIHISLEIIDPGKEAVNYSLKFFATQSTPKKVNN